jgi:prevent-host-death family protein
VITYGITYVAKEISMVINIVEDILSITKVREQIGAVVEHARETKRPIVVTQNGSAAVVIVDAVQYQQQIERIAYLEGIIAGMEDIFAGRVVSHEGVEERLDALLAE